MKTYKNRQLQGDELIKDSFGKINENSSEANADITELYQQDENLQQQIDAIIQTGSTNTLLDVFSVETSANNNNYTAQSGTVAPFKNMKLMAMFNSENTGPATINLNGKGAKRIKIAGREVKAKELKGLAFLQFNGTEWDVLDNNSLREEVRVLNQNKAEADKVLSLETQLLQAQSDITNLTQQLNNKVNKSMTTAIHLPSVNKAWISYAGMIDTQVIFGRTDQTLQNIDGIPIYSVSGQATQIQAGIHALMG